MSITAAPAHDVSSQGSPNLPYVLARHSSQDCYFDIKLTQVESTTFHAQPAQKLEFKLDLARPFSVAKRIRSARVSIEVSGGTVSKRSPRVMGINPEASLVKIADQEVTRGQSLGLTTGTSPAAPGSLSLSGNLSFGQKTSFAGNRLIHGFMVSESRAQWKMYEEPNSKSGLPPSLSLLMIVESDEDFRVSAELCVLRWSGWGSLGMVRSIPAPLPNEIRSDYLVRNKPVGLLGNVALKAQDDITTFLKESEHKMQILEDIVNKLFPQLIEEVPQVQYKAVLLLWERGHLYRTTQINVPLSPDIFPLGRETNAQSSETNGIFEAMTISQRHAELSATKMGKVFIRDVGSQNGTFVNGQRLSPAGQTSEPRELRQRDKIDFGVTGSTGSAERRRREENEKEEEEGEQSGLSVTVEFAGFPDPSNESLDLSSVQAATKPDEQQLELALAREAESGRYIEEKFRVWRSGTTNEDQLAVIEALEDLTYRRRDRRYQTLRVEPPRRDDDSSTVDYRQNRRRDYEAEDDEPVFVRAAAPPAKFAKPWYPQERRGGGVERMLFSRATGEDALATHQAVGTGWTEAKLA
ncbi:uncharacterized protein Z520_04216 [Fonsecaea multimorphosa CBS 102226]|uniref:FHA domain-containing protein n=1 Tax=Fonsecaea multimorphosa CBS 102226 TaxID=1442371 RepID=A0A0D2KSA3_9EURO|nr:uncharacterized protein Z520_04216 [Fonsecaea multimorphosa CBS 102226]KIX99583.1 hypothetical protein Z520_04216 [Fonsecaea multimorphosa CBS 102226]OAL26823.1 hypothetical protein AYO22_03990 [Fonsecaea multimorphosa]